jgi:cytoskeletal protein CcmA (bactofilin family)
MEDASWVWEESMFSKAKGEGRSGRKDQAGLSFFGADTVVSGDVATESQLHVDGRIEGNVRCVALIQGADGTIAGNVVAGQARIAGLVEGRVEAQTLIVEASARIMGDIAYESLSIAPGARVEGRLSSLGGPVAERPLTLSPRRESKPSPEPMITLADAPRAATG